MNITRILAIASIAVLPLTVASTAQAEAASPTSLPTCEFVQFDGSIGSTPTGNPVSVPCYYRYTYSNGSTTAAYYDKNGKWHFDAKNSSK